MARLKGISNRKPPSAPDTVSFTTQERLEFLAHLIAERIAKDKAEDYPLLKRIKSTGTP